MNIKEMIKKLEEKGYSIKKVSHLSSKMMFRYIINNEEFAEIEYNNAKRTWDLILFSEEAFKQLEADDCLVCYDIWFWYGEGLKQVEKQMNEYDLKKLQELVN